MNHSEWIVEKRGELVSVANAMLAGKMNSIEGVRKLCNLRFAVEDPDNEVFLRIRGIESETDTFPLGPARSSCSAEYLQRMDSQMQHFIAEFQVDILQACNEIVKAFT